LLNATAQAHFDPLIAQQTPVLKLFFQEYEDKLEKYDEDYGVIQEENANIRHDVNALITVISCARATGRWEVDSIDFKQLAFEQVFGPVFEIAKT
jgi:adenylosuccinate lyase